MKNRRRNGDIRRSASRRRKVSVKSGGIRTGTFVAEKSGSYFDFRGTKGPSLGLFALKPAAVLARPEIKSKHSFNSALLS